MAGVRNPLGDPLAERAQLRRLVGLVAAGAADQHVRRVDAALAQPLAVIGIDGADRGADLLRHLEDGSRQLRASVAVLVSVEERGPAAEDVAEPLELDPERGAGRRPAPRAPAPLELDVQADLD